MPKGQELETAHEPRPSIEEHLKQIDDFTGPGTVHHYVYTHGRIFESQELTPTESDFIARIQWSHRPQKACYWNCQMESLALPEVDGIRLEYVEGYVWPGIEIPIDHAWLAVNGKVVDPTIRVDEDERRNVGIIHPGYQYFGVALDPSACEHCLEHGKSISLIDDYECHWPLIDMSGRQARGPVG